MPNGTYGGVRVRKTRVGRKLLRFPATRFLQKSCENGSPDKSGGKFFNSI